MPRIAPCRSATALHVLVVAKSPVAGQVKTRLCPPYSYSEAARLAEAALADTLAAVAGCGAERKLVALEGPPGDWLPPGFTVFAQRGGGFNERLAGAWADADGPGVQIGMDTPQLTSGLLDSCLAELTAPRVSAVLGPAADGGWWAVGLARDWDVDVFSGVLMSTTSTGRDQLQRLRQAGHAVRLLPRLRDVDDAADAAAVAREAPGSRFAVAWASVAGRPVVALPTAS